MKNVLFLPVAVVLFVFLSVSCQKTIREVEIVNDTLIVHTIDTLVIHSKDTTLAMDANLWNCYSHNTSTIVSPGPTTFFNTSEGIKFIGQGIRRGTRLQTKQEIGFKDKTIYYKWKGTGGGQFAGFVLQAKYDPLTYDATNPPLQGADFANYSVGNSVDYALLVQENVWYYTRIKSIVGTDNYEVTTATGNYGNKGGTTIQTVVVPVYTKSGYIAIRIGDNFGGSNSYAVLGECKISSN